MTPNPYAFCSDEDVANVAASDFVALAPNDQTLVRGADGSILATDPWRLSSPTANFLGSSVGPGNVVQIVGPRPPFFPPVECFGVWTSAADSVILHRRGLAYGVGSPPSPAADVLGVVYRVVTLSPQILRASADLERRFGVSDFITGRRVSDLFDPTELRDAAVFATLSALYLDASRGTGDRLTGTPDVWGTKSRRYADLLSELLDRVEIHWSGGSAGVSEPSPSRLFARLSR